MKSIKKSSWMFKESYNLAKASLNKTGLMMLFDISFFVSFFYVMPYLAKYFAQFFIAPLAATFEPFKYLIVIIIFSIIYYILVIFAYSFFKYCVMDSIKGLFQRTEFTFKRLGRFFLMNIVLFLPAYALFNLLLANTKADYQPIVFIAAGTPLFLIFYMLTNLAHSFFYEGNLIRKSIKKSIDLLLTKLKVYKETLLILVSAGIVLFALFLGAGYIVRLTASKNYLLYLNMYSYLRIASIWISYIVFYFIILVNRISFYAIIKGKNFNAEH